MILQNNKTLYIKHDSLSADALLNICSIKSIAWPYSIDSQIEWIKKEIHSNDLHVMQYINNKLSAYMNLIAIEIIIDSERQFAFGIGNVCASEKGKGYGSVLMDNVGKYLVKNKKAGLLFCKSSLVKFYNTHGWKLLDKQTVHLEFDNKNIETMVYNIPVDYSLIEYMGNAF